MFSKFGSDLFFCIITNHATRMDDLKSFLTALDLDDALTEAHKVDTNNVGQPL